VSGSRIFFLVRHPGMPPTAIHKKCTLTNKPGGGTESIIESATRKASTSLRLREVHAVNMSHRLAPENPASINCSAFYDFSARPKDGETYFAACTSVRVRDGSPLTAFNTKFPTSIMTKTVPFAVSEARAIPCHPLNPRYWLRGQRLSAANSS
jgi:hypothetical protein